MRIALALSLALSACGSSGESLTFPRGFLFGTAVAGFQVDMGCPTLPASACEDPNSDWYQFITSPVTMPMLSGDPPSAGPGEWELYPGDLDLAARDLKNNAFRLSIEWSRIFPRATDAADGYDALKALANPDALAHYHALFAAIKARGLKPMVTLNHYTLPLWIHDGVACHQDLSTCSPRGWVDKDRTVREIAKYAGFCAREFGGEVDLWLTLNEPFTSVMIAGYLFQTSIRSNPPAVSLKVDEAKIVYQGLVEAHARMYDAIKANDTVDADGDGVASQVGLVYPMVPMYPKDPSNPLDVQGAQNIFYVWNLIYLNAVVKGDIDVNFDGTTTHRADLAGRMDFLGINYYGRAIVEGTASPIIPQLSKFTTFNPLTFVYTPSFPRGLYDMAMLVKGMGLPMYITENGIPDENDDGTAPEYLVRNLTWLTRAAHDGADLRGYFYWSLMDNYEWHLGMSVHMGLYAVSKSDPMKRRTARKAVGVYRSVIDAGRIPADLAAKYPEPR
jgi:beta-glucosidase/6-phospho-beta-glucosidase/beta-galactosidase